MSFSHDYYNYRPQRHLDQDDFNHRRRQSDFRFTAAPEVDPSCGLGVFLSVLNIFIKVILLTFS